MCAYQPTWNTQEKADLQKTKVNITKIRKIGANENKFCTGKEWKPWVQQFRQ